MAWIARPNIDSPNVYWTEGTIQEILRANAEVVDRFSSLPPGHPEYIKKCDAPAGLPIALPNKPREAFIKELRGPLPDALSSSVVNERIRAAVERLEPNVHQFFPTTVTMPDGQRDDSWWAMRPCHRVDAVAFELCEDLYQYRPRPDLHPDWYYYRSNEGNKMKIVVRREHISGMAMWYDWRFQKVFFSEGLGQHFIDEGIRGFRVPADELNRSSHVAEA